MRLPAEPSAKQETEQRVQLIAQLGGCSMPIHISQSKGICSRMYVSIRGTWVNSNTHVVCLKIENTAF